MTRHTPGPWTVVHDIKECFLVEPPMLSDGFTGGYRWFTEADARLIAAAPTLLASLKEMEDMLHLWMRDNTGPHELDVLERCEAAIAEAEGTALEQETT